MLLVHLSAAHGSPRGACRSRHRRRARWFRLCLCSPRPTVGDARGARVLGLASREPALIVAPGAMASGFADTPPGGGRRVCAGGAGSAPRARLGGPSRASGIAQAGGCGSSACRTTSRVLPRASPASRPCSPAPFAHGAPVLTRSRSPRAAHRSYRGYGYSTSRASGFSSLSAMTS